MKDFLNRYMAANRSLEKQSAEQLSHLFNMTVSTIKRSIGIRAFRPKSALNAAVLDSIMVGIASRQAAGPISREAEIEGAYTELFRNSEYNDATTRATADEESVRNSLGLAKEAFENIP